MKRYFKSKKRHKKNYIFLYVFYVFISIIISKCLTAYVPFKDIIGNKDYKIINIDKSELLFKIGSNIKINNNNKDRKVFLELKNNKKIYIYNTHQKEDYKDYDVYSAAIRLREELNKYNIDVLVEDTDIEKELSVNNYSYNDSYKITRELLLKRINDEYDLYIDLHRDSQNYDVTTVEIDNKKYARVMFVVGEKHDNYRENLNIIKTINNNLLDENISLSRGIYERSNSSFNQDISSNVILIELGGVNNNKEEVNNTISILAKVIDEYLNN